MQSKLAFATLTSETKALEAERVAVVSQMSPLIQDRPQEVVVMVGGPGSGKSTYATKKMPDYFLVSNE